MSAEKRTLRRELREQRKYLPTAVVHAAGEAVCARLLQSPWFQSAAAVAVYLADENEVPTDLIIGQLQRAGRHLYLPKDLGCPQLVRWEPEDPLRRGRGGVQEPVDDVAADLTLPAIIIVPVVAWDRRGTRLGRGGGFYDRLLAAIDPRVIRVGLAYEFQCFPELPRDPWDASMHCVITERRMVVCGDDLEAPLQKGGLQS